MSALRYLVLIASMLLFVMRGGALADGRDLFNAHCLICHQGNGQGVPGMYPPLADSIGNYVAIPAGRAYLIHVVSFGMSGPVSVHGQVYNGVMQAWPALEDQDVADVLNFALMRFNTKLLPKNFTPLTAAEVKKNRKGASALGDVRREREAVMKALASRHIASR